MFRKSLTTFAAIAMLTAPLASYAQPVPASVPRAQAQAPAASPRVPGLEIVLAVGVLVVLAGILGHRQ